jgi:hypothetical protein
VSVVVDEVGASFVDLVVVAVADEDESGEVGVSAVEVLVEVVDPASIGWDHTARHNTRRSVAGHEGSTLVV